MLTTADLDKARNDERWLGFGYLQGRDIALNSTDPECPARPELVAATDERIIADANAQGWTYEDLFGWANSKAGRWFADTAFGGGTYEQAARYLTKAEAE